MIWDVVNTVIGLIVGMLSGFYFERRQTKAAEQGHAEAEMKNRELREQLQEMQSDLTRKLEDSESKNSALREKLNEMQESLDEKIDKVTYRVSSRPVERNEPSFILTDDARQRLVTFARNMQDSAGRIDLDVLRLTLTTWIYEGTDLGFSMEDFGEVIDQLEAEGRITVFGSEIELHV